MPRYFFHVCDRRDIRVTEGLDLDDFMAAQTEAMDLAGLLIASRPSELWGGDKWCLEVTDADGMVLFVLQVLTIVKPPPCPDTGPASLDRTV